MKIKITIAVFSFLIINSISGQNIKDYFIPSNVNDEIIYYHPDPNTGLETEFSKNQRFVSNGNDTYVLYEDRLYLENEKTWSETKMLTITATEVNITKTSFTTMFETSREINHIPPQIFIKLPSINQSTNWEYVKYSGEIVKCTSELVTIIIDGEQKSAIKVIRQFYENDLLVDWATTIEYYVEDIGLWKITNKDGKIDFILKDTINNTNKIAEEKKSASLSERKRIKTVNPKGENLFGKVILSFSVDEEGNVIDILLVSTTCNSCILPAKTAIEQWKYEPLEGVGIQEGQVIIEFKSN